MMTIVVFGAGEAGRRAIAALDSGTRVVAVSDNDPAKHGLNFAGHPIIAPSAITALAPDRVVVASMYWREIVAQLQGLGLRVDQIVVAPVSSGGATGTAQAAPAAAADIPEWMSADLRADNGPAGGTPLVSIIMPSRDRVTVLPRALDSVLAQRYCAWELLVIDDGSADDSAPLLDAYRARDARIRVFRQERRGVSAARNRGLAEAKGELIAYLDSDNRWHPDYLALMVRAFRDPTRDTGYAGFNFFDWATGRFRCVGTPFSYERLQQSSAIDLNVFMHRRVLVAESGGFDESMTRLVDWELILRYTRHHPPFVIGSALADYYCEPGVARVTDTEPFLPNRVRLEAAALRRARRIRRPGPPRIAYVQYEFPALSQTFVQDEIARVIRAGLAVSVFHFRDAVARAAIPAEWDVARFSDREELARLLTARRIDLVNTHFAVPHPADFVVPLCERLELPFTLKPHAFDIFRRDHAPRHHIARTAGHAQCRAVYYLGEYHRRFLQAQGVPAEKLVGIRNVFELEEFWVQQPEARPEVRRVLTISRFIEKKGFHLLIPAFRALPDPLLRLELHGYGEERERLLALAAGDPRVSIHEGPRTPAETAERLRQSDLFVLPCVEDRNGDTDGLPTVLMEAMAAGVPVVTTPIASTPDLVRDGDTGILVESGSVSALEQGLRRAVSLPAAERRRLAEAARLHLRTEFDPALNTARLLRSWQTIIPEAFRDVRIRT